MEHVKDCCKPINMTEFAKSVCGLMPSKEKAAQDANMTPYESLAWTTALAIVREKVRGSEVTKNAIEFDDYFRGRYEMARDILAEMEERGKP